MNNEPNIYQINSRVWIKRFRDQGEPVTISQIPDEYWRKLKELGMDYIWLMGLWETIPPAVDKYCFTPELVEEYKQALPDFVPEDVIGSPYAINDYNVNEIFGDREDLYSLKHQLNSVGLKLILDFIPNHFHAETKLLGTNPEIFLQADKKLYDKDNLTFYNSDNTERYYAHGKDPYYTAWQDTVQVNYFSEEAREFMTGKLLELSGYCDGVRCDVAMLAINDVFEKTWQEVIASKNLSRPESEFWVETIKTVKNRKKDFIFIAEVYWEMEWTLQQQGFDYTYDKSLYDRLKKEDAISVNEHLKADPVYQSKSVRFIENHDEKRAAEAFGERKSLAAAFISGTIPGMHFYHDGQLEGRRIWLPAQLGRQPDESVNKEIYKFYTKLLAISKAADQDEDYQWELIDCKPAGSDDPSYNNFIAYKWSGNNTVYILVTNYSDKKSYCRLPVKINVESDRVILADKLTGNIYERLKDEMENEGLFIELDKFESHFFEIKN